MEKKIHLILFPVIIGISFIANEIIDRFALELPLTIIGEENHIIQEFDFLDQDSVMISSENLKGKIWIVNYFFTSCPSVCPRMMANIKSVNDYIKQDEDIITLSFTVDPKRDDTKKLNEYASIFNIDSENWKLFTGKKRDLYALARYSFLLSATDGNGDESDFIHSENIVIVDVNGKIRNIVNGLDDESPKSILNSIRKLKKENK